MEAGSAASLQDGGEGDLFLGLFGTRPGAEETLEETLEDAIARLNEEDGNIQLQVRVTYAMPLPAEATEGQPPPDSGGFGDTFFGPDPGPQPTASAQQEVDLYLAGTASLEIKVVAE